MATSCAENPSQAKQGGQKKQMAAMVRVAPVELRDVPLDLQAVGNAEAFAVVAIKSRVTGQLTKVRVREGASVAEGELLFEIDPQPFIEQLRAVEATLARDRAGEQQALAEIERARAQSATAGAQWERYQELLKQGIAARQQAEEIRAAAKSAEANVKVAAAALESARAAIRADEARVAQAKLDLSYTKILAPSAGRAGFLLVKAGNLVRANETELVSIAQVAPIFVTFAVPERHLAEIRAAGAGGRNLAAEVVQEDGSVLAQGRLDVIDNAVDTTTGTIKLKAIFPNRDRLLWPGQFVSVRLRLRVDSQVTSVPKTAIQVGPEGEYVWVVSPEKTAEQRMVEVARTRNDVAVVRSGLKQGESVITFGHLKVAPGVPIQVIR
jgi:multidrug efflux system membrane fusion protein